MTPVGLVSQHQLNWTLLYDWTGFLCLGNFQSWPLFLIFRLELNSLLFTFPAHKYSPPQILNRLALACYSLHVPNCYSQINSSFWQFWICFSLPLSLGLQGGPHSQLTDDSLVVFFSPSFPCISHKLKTRSRDLIQAKHICKESSTNDTENLLKFCILFVRTCEWCYLCTRFHWGFDHLLLR